MTLERKRLLLVAAPVVLAALAVGFWLFRPDTLFIDDVVDEKLDADVAAALAETPTPTPTPAGGDRANVGTATASPDGASASPTDAATNSASVTPTAPTTPTPVPTPTTDPARRPEAIPTGPTVLARGTWTSLEHTTTGSVAVVDDAGDLQLVLTDLDGSNGPDLHVILSPKAADGDDWFGYQEGAVYLGALKGNQGNQGYDIPDDIDLDRFASVVIWCERFSVGFGAADLVA